MRRWIRRGIVRPLRRAIIAATALALALTPWSAILGGDNRPLPFGPVTAGTVLRP